MFVRQIILIIDTWLSNYTTRKATKHYDECLKDVTALSDLQLWLIMIRWVISIFGDQLHYSDAMMSCCCWINWATVTNNARGCLSLVVVLMNNSTTVRPKIRRQFVWYWWHAKWGICWWCTQVNASTSVSLSVASDYSPTNGTRLCNEWR